MIMRMLCHVENMMTFLIMSCFLGELGKIGHLIKNTITGGLMCQFGRDVLEKRIESIRYRLSATLEECVFGIKKECLSNPHFIHSLFHCV